MRTLLFCIPLAGSLLWPAVEARACEPLPCTPGEVRPRAGQTVPASVPALLHRPPRDWRGDMDAGEAAPPVLLGPDGGEVPLQRVAQGTWEEWVPTTALAPHTAYTFRFTERCQFSASGTTGVVEVPFRTREATPLPTEAGQLVLLREEVAPIGVPDASRMSSCGSTTDVLVRAATARVGFIPSAEFAAHLPVADVWAQVQGGTVRARQATTTERERVPGLSSVFTLFALCELPDGGTTELGLPEGDHTLHLVTHLPGQAPALAPLTLQVHLDCDAGQPPEEPETQPPQGGCTASAGATTGAALALLALLARGRRVGTRAFE